MADSMIPLKLTRFDPIGFLRNNLKDKWTSGIPLRRLVHGWRHGFSSEHIRLFDLWPENDEWRNYLPDLYRYRVTLKTNEHVWIILHDKLVFDAFMADKLPVIPALCSITNGRFGGWTKEQFLNEVRNGTKIIVKAARGGTGVGLLFVEATAGGVRVNGNVQAEGEFAQLLATLPYHVCYPRVEAHSRLSAVFPGSANALRVTIFVGTDGRARLLAPAFCIGTAKSAPLEHLCNGGIVAHIDAESGTCVDVIRQAPDGGREHLTHHPDTGAPLLGLEIPFWTSIKQALLTFHERYPGFDLVGWDILVAEDRFWVIEGNHNPGIRIPLLNRNLRQEPEFREFLVKRGILPV